MRTSRAIYQIGLAFVALLAAVPQTRATEALFPFEVHDVSIPMEDGGKLSGKVYLPGEGPHPTIVTITQSSHQSWDKSHLPRASFARSGDYAVLFVNTRGRRASRDNPTRGGRNPFGKDGYDVIEWAASQSWSDGKIGMWGGSNEGKNQYATAQAQPPHLRCIMPALTTSDTKEEGTLPRSYEQLYLGGVLRRELIDRLPPSSRALQQVLSHPLHDASFWERRDPTAPTVADIEVPVMAIGAWFDNDVNRASLRTFKTLLSETSVALRPHHRLLIGPWTHTGMYIDGLHGQLSYDNSAQRYQQREKQFFDHWLLGADNGEEKVPAITYYQMGVNRWRTTPHWPPEGMCEVSFFLHPDRTLSSVPPPNGAASVAFASDPDNPVPTVGGQNKTQVAGKGPWDQREKVEAHHDAFVFSTAPLERDLEIAGDVSLRLHLSSDAEDTDVAFRLTDVHPDGRSMLLRDGIVRLSLRNSFERYEFLTPGEIYAATVETIPIAHTFEAGHRLRLIVSGSNYPRWDVSGNTRDKSAPPRVATNALHLEPEHPTHLVLPVIDTSVSSKRQTDGTKSERKP